jgi:hypothetical protein
MRGRPPGRTPASHRRSSRAPAATVRIAGHAGERKARRDPIAPRFFGPVERGSVLTAGMDCRSAMSRTRVAASVNFAVVELLTLFDAAHP